jgi:hypothetical protein
MQCPLQDIILGDMNVKVGREIWTGIAVGNCGDVTKVMLKRPRKYPEKYRDLSSNTPDRY